MGPNICKSPRKEIPSEEVEIIQKKVKENKSQKDEILVNKILDFNHHNSNLLKNDCSYSITSQKNENLNKFMNSMTSNQNFEDCNKKLANQIKKFSYSDAKSNNSLFQNKLIKFDPSKFVQENKGDCFKFYDIIDKLSKSDYFEIFRARSKITKEIYAIKSISKSICQDEKLVLSEIDILRQMDHPNILKILEYFQDPKNIYIVTECYKGKELWTYLKIHGKLTEKEVAVIMAQVLSAISYCHNQNIVIRSNIIRDLRLESIVIEENSQNNIKVIDFGMSKLLNSNELSQEKVKINPYLAPEVLNNKYDNKCDLWSCGIIMYTLLTGNTPYTGLTKDQMCNKIKMGTIPYTNPVFEKLSKDAIKLLKNLLSYDSKFRISAQDALDDIWIVKFTHKIEFEPKGFAESLGNLHQFNSTINFQRAALSFIAKRLTKKDSEDKLRGIFKMLDVNNDGQLSKQELIEGYKMITGDAEVARVQVEHIMENLDVNMNNTVDYNEFLMANIDLEILENEDKLKQAFGFFDEDGSGDISIEELKRIFNETEESDIVEKILREIDYDSNGRISFEEFKAVIKKFIEQNKVLKG